MRVGLISDTHGLLRPQALAALDGVDHIIHAGDIGGEDILHVLRELAPLSVVRGNNDTAPWARAVPHALTLTLAGVAIHVIHDVKELRGKAPADVVVSGHSHKPLVQEREGVLFVNPGSAGPRRFSLPIAVALLDVDEGQASARIILLDPTRPGPTSP